MSGSAFGPGAEPSPPEDPWETPAFKVWAKRVKEEMLPKLEESALTTALFSGKVDVKMAVEIGYTLLLGKPLVLAVEPGSKVPNGLARAADAIVEMDYDVPGEMAERLNDAMRQLRAAGKLDGDGDVEDMNAEGWRG